MIDFSDTLAKLLAPERIESIRLIVGRSIVNRKLLNWIPRRRNIWIRVCKGQVEEKAT